MTAIPAQFPVTCAPKRRARGPGLRGSATDNVFYGSFEKSRRTSVGPKHGGYGVLAEGFLVGPYFDYDNAHRECGRFSGAIVVRWVDFVKESTANDACFREVLRALSEPLTVQVRGYLRPVSIHAPRNTYPQSSAL